jgi:hypothetical protein
MIAMFLPLFLPIRAARAQSRREQRSLLNQGYFASGIIFNDSRTLLKTSEPTK